MRALYGPEAGDGWPPDSMETPSPRFMASPDGGLPTLPRVLTETYGGDKHSYVTRAAYPVRVMARHWLAVRKANPDGCPAFPLAPIVRAWRDHRPRDPSRRHLHATKERHPPKGVDPLTMTRQPGVLSLVSHAPLEAVEVDGQAFVTRTLGGVATKTRRYRLADSQGDLFPGPRTLAGDATAGVIFEAVACMLLTGDERSPLRADLLRLANLAFALSGPVRLTETEGALFVAGSDTQPNRNRFNNALWGLRGLGVQVRPGTWWRMAAADPDRGNVIGPADWWRDAMTGRLKDAPAAWSAATGRNRAPMPSGTCLLASSAPRLELLHHLRAPFRLEFWLFTRIGARVRASGGWPGSGRDWLHSSRRFGVRRLCA